MRLTESVLNVWRQVIAIACVIAGCASAFAQDQPVQFPFVDPMVDWPVYTDPSLSAPTPVQNVLNPRYKEIWNEALDRPEAELRRRTADAIGNAYEQGYKDYVEFIPRLTKMLGEQGLHPVVKLSVVRALIRLDARTAAPQFRDFAKGDDTDLVLLVDPALAQWKDEPTFAAWIRRAEDTKAAPSLRVSAINAVGVARAASASETLRKIVQGESNEPGVQLAAAQALGLIKTSGLEEVAESVLKSTPASGKIGPAMNREIIAASLLSHHRGDRAQTILLRLAASTEPAAARVALEQLLRIDPLLIKPLSSRLLLNEDNEVRRCAIEATFAQRSVDCVRDLRPLLDDVVPALRRRVRDCLIVLGKDPSLAAAVRDAGMTSLLGKDVRALEQAALLLGKLDHKPAQKRLLELMALPGDDYTIARVRVAALAALRWLAVPETVPVVFARGESLYARANEMLASSEKPTSQPSKAEGMRMQRESVSIDAELSQIMQMMGERRYKPAEAIMRRMIPKSKAPIFEARGAAVWSLGFILEDKNDEALGKQLEGRILDYLAMPPDFPEGSTVRRSSALTIGRMRVKAELPFLKRFQKEDLGGDVGRCCEWSITRMTGETFPPPVGGTAPVSGFFIEPIPAADDAKPVPAKP